MFNIRFSVPLSGKLSINKAFSALAATTCFVGLSAPAAIAGGGSDLKVASGLVNNQAYPGAASSLAAAAPSSASRNVPLGLADGSGVWINIWNYPTADYEGYCQKLYSSGIRNLFVQSSRSNTAAIAHPAELGALIDACHKYKIRVIAWSFAELANPRADADKMIAVARFRSPMGDCLDAIAPDLEKNLSKPAVEAYSKYLRQALGADYPMIAVVYSPLNKAPQVAITPWKLIDKYYDVIAPMAYWNGRYQTIDAYTYTRRTIEKIRQLTERPDVEVHVIGDGMGTRTNEITEFMRACRDSGAQSASLYPNHKTTEEQYVALSRYDDLIPTNSKRRLEVLRDLLGRGVVASPPSYDPSKALSRGEFMKVVAHGLKVPGINDSQEAFSYFKRLGVVDMVATEFPEMAADDDLISPVSLQAGQRFVSLAKRAMASKPKVGRRVAQQSPYLTMNRPSRVDRLFAAPVYAATNQGPVSLSDGQPNHEINYLDAAALFDELSR